MNTVLAHLRSSPRIALEDKQANKRLTYDELIRAGAAWGEYLSKKSQLPAGCPVVLCLSDGIDWVTACIGCWAAGMTPVPVSHQILEHDLRYVLELTGSPGIVFNPLDRDLTAFPGIRHIATTSATETSLSTEPVFVTVSNEHLDALVLFTSGSSGRPKGVRISHEAVWLGATSLVDGMTLHHEHLMLQVPLSHIFGAGMALWSGLLSQSRVLFMPPFRPDTWLETVESCGGTVSYGPPEMFWSITKCPGFDEYDISSLSKVLFGGSPVTDLQASEVMTKLGLKQLFFTYGLTETTGGITLSPFKRPDGSTLVSAGRPLHSIECAIIQDGRVQEPGQEGEICTRGAQMMKGYMGQPERDPASWFHTGDVGVIDKDGLLHVTGRIKDIIIRAGENISPVEVEEALCEHPAVQDACVVGLPDEIMGEKIAAVVVAKKGAVTKKELRLHCHGKLDPSKIPQKIVFVDTIPKTDMGKTHRKKVRESMIS